MSRDEGCLVSRADQLSVVRTPHTKAQNSRLCVSRDESYLVSRTDQLSVVWNSHNTAQNSGLCVSERRKLSYFANRPDISGAELSRHSSAVQYGNYSSVTEHLPAIWEKLGEDVRNPKILGETEIGAHEIPNLGFSPLAAVVRHKVRIINASSVRCAEQRERGSKRRH